MVERQRGADICDVHRQGQCPDASGRTGSAKLIVVLPVSWVSVVP